MINITVFSNQNISLEEREFIIDSQNQMIEFLRELIKRIKFSGEIVCVEQATITEHPTGSPTVIFKEIERW